MAHGCRDCAACVAPPHEQMGRAVLAGFIHLCTCGISWVVSRAVRRCSVCDHHVGRHLPGERPDPWPVRHRSGRY